MQGLKENSGLFTIRLGNCGVSHKALLGLCEILDHSPNLKAVDLSSNSLHSADDFEALKQLMERTNLTQLSLASSTCENVFDGSCISRALANNAFLERLDLSRNQFVPADMERIAAGLVSNPKALLQSLRISSMLSPKNGVLRPLFENLGHCSSLTHLDVSQIRLEQDCTEALCKVLETNKSLRSLNVSGASQARACLLCRSLVKNCSLRVLQMCYLPDHDSLQAVGHMLQHNTTLQCLCVASAHDYSPMLCALRYNRTLRSLRMSGNRFDRDTLLSLARALSVNATLVDIHASYFEPRCEEAGTAIRDALCRQPRYRALALSGIPLPKLTDFCNANCCALHDDDSEWTNEAAMACLQRMHADKATAFALGQLARLGAGSAVVMLTSDCVGMVLLCYFGLPLDYLNQRENEMDYVEILEDLRRSETWT
jgi:Ran GTPase-activating protein (RanGAP) involved in mRNA processing and transport